MSESIDRKTISGGEGRRLTLEATRANAVEIYQISAAAELSEPCAAVQAVKLSATEILFKSVEDARANKAFLQMMKDRPEKTRASLARKQQEACNPWLDR